MQRGQREAWSDVPGEGFLQPNPGQQQEVGRAACPLLGWCEVTAPVPHGCAWEGCHFYWKHLRYVCDLCVKQQGRARDRAHCEQLLAGLSPATKIHHFSPQ